MTMLEVARSRYFSAKVCFGNEVVEHLLHAEAATDAKGKGYSGDEGEQGVVGEGRRTYHDAMGQEEADREIDRLEHVHQPTIGATDVFVRVAPDVVLQEPPGDDDAPDEVIHGAYFLSRIIEF